MTQTLEQKLRELTFFPSHLSRDLLVNRKQVLDIVRAHEAETHKAEAVKDDDTFMKLIAATKGVTRDCERLLITTKEAVAALRPYLRPPEVQPAEDVWVEFIFQMKLMGYPTNGLDVKNSIKAFKAAIAAYEEKKHG